MRILLDNCVHKAVANFFPGHDVRTARKMNWHELSNGKLLAAAAMEFDVLVTTDQNLRFQQNLSKLSLPVIELQSTDGRIDALQKLVPLLPEALDLTRRFWFIAVLENGSCEALAPRT